MRNLMKTASMTAAVLFTAGAAMAAPQVDEIVVNQGAHTPEGTNIRVNVMNDGMASPAMDVVLYARETGSMEWTKVKSWNHRGLSEVGKMTAYDYFGLADPNWDSPLYTQAYELKAVLEDSAGMANEASAVYASSNDAEIFEDTADVELLPNGDVMYPEQ